MANNFSYFLLTLLLLFTLTVTGSSSQSMDDVKPSTPLVSFLEILQHTAFNTFGNSNFDPKTYVDLPLKFPLSVTDHAFHNLSKSSTGSVSVHDLNRFIETYFHAAGHDLVYSDPEDFVPEPDGFLPKVKNPEVRAWAIKVHSLWKNLSRKVSSEVKTHPNYHTLLPVPGSVVIPGSRFREVYYWDSYWVIRGLLVSKMYKTAKSIVTNLISLIEEYGFVLNGARAYYTNRSQPPLLSAMIYEIYARTGDIELVKRSLPALLKEHEFWNSDIHKVNISDAQGCTRTLNRYYARWNKPRPESSTMDKASASKFTTVSEKQHFYRELASAAESGWDFSTRWMRHPPNFTTLSTTSVIPVDLNAFLLGMELNIAFFANVTGDNRTAEHFLQISDVRKEAINSVFWNANMKQWLDSWLSNTTHEVQVWDTLHQNQNVFASNFVPLWMKPFYSDALLVSNVLKSLKTSGLLRAAGVATSLSDSGQQWDFPNGWAPLQHMLVEGLIKSGLEEARSLAEEIAIRWITTNYIVYKKTGVMHEKFDVEHCGEFGGGGEYVPQTGFGWSNGVVLAFLEEFGWPEDRKIEC
ncbi:probable trehalase isoform X1 [Medicago truncatula]|uniref:Trehalase n=2 Tax=Medicago truncatula TaxID=3880 RepID=A0A072TV17_MEDTR|nr:probable trehalase isoform X1 [Medicago truncatula]KEH21287.1 trehalase [Medicago truncatula]